MHCIILYGLLSVPKLFKKETKSLLKSWQLILLFFNLFIQQQYFQSGHYNLLKPMTILNHLHVKPNSLNSVFLQQKTNLFFKSSIFNKIHFTLLFYYSKLMQLSIQPGFNIKILTYSKVKKYLFDCQIVHYLWQKK